jgi:hypothetical protein
MKNLSFKKLTNALNVIYEFKSVGKDEYDPRIHSIPDAEEGFSLSPNARFAYCLVTRDDGAEFHQFADGSMLRVA